MKALEFEACLEADGTLAVPGDVAAQLPPGRRVRVLLLVQDRDEELAWNELAAAQFLKGYADTDAVYDQLSGQ